LITGSYRETWLENENFKKILLPPPRSFTPAPPRRLLGGAGAADSWGGQESQIFTASGSLNTFSSDCRISDVFQRHISCQKDLKLGVLQLQNKFNIFLSRSVSDGKAPLSFSFYSKARCTQKLLSMPKICFDNAYVPHIS